WVPTLVAELIWDDTAKILKPVALTVAGCAVLGLNSAVFRPTTDSATFFQVKDKDGNVIANVDTVNNRFGVGTITPGRPMEIFSSSAVLRLRDSGDTASATTAYIEFGGTTAGNWDRTGYVGDGSSGDTHIRLRAEKSDLYLGDSTGETVLILSGGDATFSGSINVGTSGKIYFRDTDISIGSTLTDGILDITADFSIDLFFDNADVGDEADGQSLNINRRAVEGDDYISLYVDKDKRGLIGFSGDNDLLQLTANALTVNGTLHSSFVDDEQVGLGTNSPSSIYKVHIKRESTETLSRTLLVEHETTQINAISSALTFKLTTTGDMTTNFGPGFLYAIEDTAGVENFIGRTAFARDGADNSGKFFLSLWNAGSFVEKAMVVTKEGYVGLGLSSPDTPLYIHNAQPYITLRNLTHEDTDGGRESRIIFYGEQSGGERTTLARIEISHDGTSDDEKGKIVISTNDGADGDTPTDHFKVDAAGNTYIGDGGVTDYSQFEPDGTYVMNGAATVFNDLVVSLSSAKVPPANAPSWVSFVGNLNAYAYDLNDFQEFSNELAHSYKDAALIEFHV
ncbi:hypothetical protein LCGC14_2320560, partial [marine sediment metagenome]